MSTEDSRSELLTKQEATLKSKSEMCGWALLQMAKDKRQLQKSELRKPQKRFDKKE